MQLYNYSLNRVENVIKQLIHESAVRSSRYEALGKFGEHSISTSTSISISIRIIVWEPA